MTNATAETPIAEETLHAVFESANVAMGFVDAAGILVAVNSAFGELSGCARGELVGRPLADLVPGAAGLFPGAADAAAGSSGDWELRRKDGLAVAVLATWRRMASPRAAPMTLVTLADIDAHVSAMRGSQEQYRNLTENFAEGILVIQDARMAYANPSVLALIGYPWEELEGREFLPFVHPDFREMVLTNYRKRITGEPVEPRYDLQILHRSGEAVWVELGAVVIPWKGRPATLSFVSDIRVRKRAEEALRESEEQLRRSEQRYRELFDNASEGIVVVQDGMFVMANRAALALTGYSDTLAIGGGFFNMLHPDDREDAIDRHRRRMRGESPERRHEMRVMRADGSVAWVETSAVTIQWEGRPAALTFVADISERKRLEEELRRSLEERNTILQNTLVGVMRTVDGRCQWINRKFVEMCGYPAEELIGKSVAVHFPDERSHQAFVEACEPVLAGGEAHAAECELRRSDGTLYWAQLLGNRIDPADASQGVIWTCLDVSERRRAEENIRRALDRQRELNELKSRFVSMTSHEFRTPLAAILSSAQLMRLYGERLPAPEKEELVGSIEDGVQRMSKMLDDILVIGRAEAGMLTFRPAALDVRAFCESLLEEVRAAAASARQGPRAELLLEFRGDAPQRMADERLLRHALGNLLSNAVKYSPNGGSVRLEVSCTPDEVAFAVRDEGIGLPAEDLPRLFETFFRASNAGNIPGTGLGLAIVKRSVELHGGRIAVESAPGRGSCFRVMVPAPLAN
jgi:PAS domain S-box-containing protein